MTIKGVTMRVFSVLGLFVALGLFMAGSDHVETLVETRAKAEQGDAVAQFDLGWMYDKGKGVPQDDEQAAAWYLKSAEQGNAKAQFDLGWMYDKGSGVPKDYAQAYMWVNLAAAQGNENTIKFSDFAVKSFTPSQIEEGQRLAREWLAAHPQARGE